MYSPLHFYNKHIPTYIVNTLFMCIHIPGSYVLQVGMCLFVQIIFVEKAVTMGFGIGIWFESIKNLGRYLV